MYSAYSLALELGVPVGVVLSMSIEEWEGWHWFFEKKNHEEKKRAKKAERGRR